MGIPKGANTKPLRGFVPLGVSRKKFSYQSKQLDPDEGKPSKKETDTIDVSGTENTRASLRVKVAFESDGQSKIRKACFH